MPELPEVETTRRGIQPRLEGKRASGAIVRNPRLRWPVPENLAGHIAGQRLNEIRRRAKYLLFAFEQGTLIVHLGMSGSLRVLTEAFPPERHEHIDLLFEDGLRLRYRDPRRFGAFLWTEDDPSRHPLLRELGPEPLFNRLQRRLSGERPGRQESRHQDRDHGPAPRGRRWQHLCL